MLPTFGAHDSTGLTYLPRIHIYRDTHISPPCSNPRSAPPPRRGVFCCGAKKRGCRRFSPMGSRPDAPVHAPVSRSLPNLGHRQVARNLDTEDAIYKKMD